MNNQVVIFPLFLNGILCWLILYSTDPLFTHCSCMKFHWMATSISLTSLLLKTMFQLNPCIASYNGNIPAWAYMNQTSIQSQLNCIKYPNFIDLIPDTWLAIHLAAFYCLLCPFHMDGKLLNLHKVNWLLCVFFIALLFFEQSHLLNIHLFWHWVPFCIWIDWMSIISPWWYLNGVLLFYYKIKYLEEVFCMECHGEFLKVFLFLNLNILTTNQCSC